MNDQQFDKWLQEALSADVTAPEDFTARVMDRVAATPQEYPRAADKRKLKRMMTALAACAAIVILIPVGLLMMPMGKSAPAADCAMPEAAMDDAAADMEFFADGADNYNGAASEMQEERKTEPAEGAAAPADDGMSDGGESQMQTTTADGNTTDDKLKISTLTFDGDEAAMLHALLTEKGIQPAQTQGTLLYYTLDETQAAVLREEVPELIEAEGALHLTLEVAG